MVKLYYIYTVLLCYYWHQYPLFNHIFIIIMCSMCFSTHIKGIDGRMKTEIAKTKLYFHEIRE